MNLEERKVAETLLIREIEKIKEVIRLLNIVDTE